MFAIEEILSWIELDLLILKQTIMSYLNIQVGNITPISKNGHQISLASVQLLVSGELSGKGQDPYGIDAVLAAVVFPKTFTQKPVSAWIGNFEGGDFAEVLWSITNLSAEGFILFAANQDLLNRYPHGSKDGSLVINVVVAFETAELPAAKKETVAAVKENKPAKAVAVKAEPKPKAAKAAKPAVKKA